MPTYLPTYLPCLGSKYACPQGHLQYASRRLRLRATGHRQRQNNLNFQGRFSRRRLPSDPRQGLAVVDPFWRCGGSFCGVMASGDIAAPGPSSFHLPLSQSVPVPLHVDTLDRTKRGVMAPPRRSIMAEGAEAAYHPGRMRGGHHMRFASCQPASPPSARPVSQIRLPLSWPSPSCNTANVDRTVPGA